MALGLEEHVVPKRKRRPDRALSLFGGVVKTIPELRKYRKDQLRERVKQLRAEEEVAAEEARQLVDEGVLAKDIIHDDGSSSVLVGVEEGRPIYTVSYGLDASKTIATDDVWPGGSGGL